MPRSLRSEKLPPKRRSPVKRGVLRRTHDSEVSEGGVKPLKALPGEWLLKPRDKRELILAHAAARAARRVGGKWTYLIGVSASCLVLVSGWWLTVGTELRQRLQIPTANRPSFSQEVRKEMNSVEESLGFPQSAPSFSDFLPSSTSGSTGTTGTEAAPGAIDETPSP